jgi:hypothetical protein
MAEQFNTQVEEVSQVEEIWKPVVGRENFYSVSSLGRLRSEYSTLRHPPRMLSGYIDAAGYVRFALVKPKPRTEFLHHIVAAAFIGPRPDRMEVNHMDGVPTNCSAANLEYLTPGDNQRHAYRIGLRKEPLRMMGFDNPLTKLSDLQVRAICLLRTAGMLCKEIAQVFNISASHTASITLGYKRDCPEANIKPTRYYLRRTTGLTAEQVQRVADKLKPMDLQIMQELTATEYRTRREIAEKYKLTEAQVSFAEKRARHLVMQS